MGDDAVGAGEAADQRIIEPRVEMDQPDLGEMLLAGDAAAGRAVEAAGGIVGAAFRGRTALDPRRKERMGAAPALALQSNGLALRLEREAEKFSAKPPAQ